MTKDTVLILEPNFTGHRWRYAEWAADACVEAGYRCLIVTASENRSHALVQRIEAAADPRLSITFIDPPAGASRAGFGRVSYVRFFRDFRYLYREATRTRDVAFVVVPYVDYFFYALPFTGSPFGKTPWVGITMRASFHHAKVGVRAPNQPLVNLTKAALFRRALRSANIRTLLSIDPTLADWYGGARDGSGAAVHPITRAAQVRYLADPFPDAQAIDPQEARRRLGLDDGKHLLIYGAITERKGIRELVDALASVPAAQTAAMPRLVIAGSQDEDTQTWLAEAGKRLARAPVVLDRFISDEMERDLFSACDAVWLGYKGHYGMSGVLVQAYRFDKPLIATADGLIGWFCRDGQLGPVLPDLSRESIVAALDSLFGEASATRGAQLQALAAKRGTPHLLEQNTLGAFKRTLQQAMG